jgi:CHAT domain-containing protein/tetratricopeptide (TPR) repeat protein
MSFNQQAHPVVFSPSTLIGALVTVFLFFAAQVSVSPALTPSREEAYTLLKSGSKRFEAGDTAGALPLLEQAAQQLHAAGDLKGEAEALRAIGDAYAAQGDLFTSVATDRYGQAVELFRQASLSTATSGLNVAADMNYNAQVTLAKLGDLYFRQGKADDAQRYYNQIAPDKAKADAFDTENARRKAQNLKNKPGSTKSRTESVGRRFGNILSKKPSLDTLGSVTSTADEAAATAKDAADTAVGVVEDLHRANLLLKGYVLSDISLGRVALLRSDEASAQQHFASALAFATNYPPIFGKGAAAKRYQIVAQTELANLAFKQGRLADAGKLYAEARDRARGANRPDLSWPAARGIGRSQWAMAQTALNQSQGQPPRSSSRFAVARDSALKSYRESIATIEELRGRSIRGDEARQSFSAQTSEVYSEFTELLATLAFTTSGGDFSRPLQGEALAYAGEAFATTEKGRSRALLDSLGNAGDQITEGIDPSLLQKRSELIEHQSELADQLIGLSERDRGANVKDDESLEASIDQLSVEAAQIEAQIRTASPRYAALTSAVPLSMVEVQSQLTDDKTVLLDYLVGDKQSYLWVVSHDSARLVPLASRSEIIAAASQVRDQLLASASARVFEPALANSSSNADSRSGVKKEPAKASTAPKVVGNKIGTAAPGGSSKVGAGRQPSTQGTSRDLEAVGVPERPKVRPLVETPEARKFAEAAYGLYKSVLAPAESALGDKRLLIIRDDILNYIPFEALVTSLPAQASEAPADFASLSYLLRSHEVAYAPSATVLAVIRREHPTKLQGRAALIVGDPVFDSGDPRAKAHAETSTEESSARDLLLTAMAENSSTEMGGSQNAEPAATHPSGKTSEGAAKIPRLPATRAESTQIARIVKQAGGSADLLLDLQANENDLLARDLRDYRFLHFATHGLLNADHPQFSGLVLSLVGNPPSRDGFLRTQEIFNMRLGSPVVMLSACKTGLGRMKKGEGLIGLTRAFLYAGATTVGVSLWPVDDNSTAELMTDFYARLLGKQSEGPASAGGQPSSSTLSAAMRAAQLRLVDERRYSAPYFWAPFVLVGDYR